MSSATYPSDPRDPVDPQGRRGVPREIAEEDDPGYEEEPEISLTKLIHRNSELIQGLKQQLARAKRRMTEKT